MVATSRLPGFSTLSLKDRIATLAESSGLGEEAVALLHDSGNLPADTLNRLIENAVGTMNVPIGIATNMVIDGEEVLVPMATEESSVVAAVCNMAKRCRSTGGFHTSYSGSSMIAQVQVVGLSNPHGARLGVLEKRDEVQAICDATDPVLLKHGGGFRDLEARVLETQGGPMLVLHLIVDTRDAMGANAVNSMAEALAPRIEQWTGGRVYLRILSNLADRRLARARAVWTPDELGGPEVRDGILQAYYFAKADPYRAATHNKGIMNGVSAVVLATGNDSRAVEAGAHAYAARHGRYSSLTHWEADGDGNLVGAVEMPLAVGLIGGATRVHPMAQVNLQILGARTAERLARIIAAVGLAQNVAALRALATTGIQKGHMALHAQNVAMMAGALGAEVDQVAAELRKRGTVRADVAEEILAALRAAEA